MLYTLKTLQNKLVLIATCCLLSACTKYSPLELLTKLNEAPEYQASAQSELCDYRVQWLPKEYLAAQELQNKKSVAASTVQEKLKSYERSMYFRLSLQLKSGANAMLSDVPNTEAYARKWQYLTHGMQRNLYVLTAEYDTIYPSFYSFQNPFVYNDRLNFLYVFPKDLMGAQEETLTLKFKDEVFAQQTLSFDIKDFKGLTEKKYDLTLKN